jgi:hypothetical protein
LADVTFHALSVFRRGASAPHIRPSHLPRASALLSNEPAQNVVIKTVLTTFRAGSMRCPLCQAGCESVHDELGAGL